MKGLKTSFTICNTEFTFNIINISKVFRINPRKFDKIVDFDNKVAIKLEKSKYGLRLCKASNKTNGTDIIPYLKSNYEFMSQVLNFINLISRTMKPRSIDYSDIVDDESSIEINEYPMSDNDVVIKWKNEDINENKDKILITIF